MMYLFSTKKRDLISSSTGAKVLLYEPHESLDQGLRLSPLECRQGPSFLPILPAVQSYSAPATVPASIDM